MAQTKRHTTKPAVTNTKEGANNARNNYNQHEILEDYSNEEEEEIEVGIENRKTAVKLNQTKAKDFKNARNYDTENISLKTIDTIIKKCNEEREEHMSKEEYRVQK